MIITIDGPVASGKSSVAKALAKKLGFYYLYTGLLYRAVAYVLINVKKILSHDFTDDDVKQVTDFSWIKDITYSYHDDRPHVFYQGQEITQHLSAVDIEQVASRISAHSNVRQALLELQRTIANDHNLIADGRDCGTVVFPDADLKFFLTADVDVRAQRLLNDQSRGAGSKTLEEICASIEERDRRDQTRSIAPLKVPVDAVIVDSSHFTFDQSVATFLQIITQQLMPS